MKGIRAATLLALFAGGIRAASAMTASDYTDLWWNADASGEGFTVIQQGDTLFITFFVHDASQRPVWYVGSNMPYALTDIGFKGDLYVTQGPPGSSVIVTKVGSATFLPTSANAATITYTVNGTPFTKALTRQTWRSDDISGAYLGAKIGVYDGSACASNGYLEEPYSFVVTHRGTAVTLQTRYSTYSCTITGTYAQSGRLGSIAGSFTCSTGTSGTYTADEIEVTAQGITGRSGSSRTNCHWIGHFGGVRQSAH